MTPQHDIPLAPDRRPRHDATRPRHGITVRGVVAVVAAVAVVAGVYLLDAARPWLWGAAVLAVLAVILWPNRAEADGQRGSGA